MSGTAVHDGKLTKNQYKVGGGLKAKGDSAAYVYNPSTLSGAGESQVQG